MPSRDQTGPFGEGKMTGRGLGICLSNNKDVETETSNSQASLGLGMRRMGSASFGRGCCGNRRRGSFR